MCYYLFSDITFLLPIPVVDLSKAVVCGHSLDGIAG
jgi:hypothetical protein